MSTCSLVIDFLYCSLYSALDFDVHLAALLGLLLLAHAVTFIVRTPMHSYISSISNEHLLPSTLRVQSAGRQ